MAPTFEVSTSPSFFLRWDSSVAERRLVPPQLGLLTWRQLQGLSELSAHLGEMCGLAGVAAVALLGRFYERFADHAVEVARRVIFEATGEFYQQPRPMPTLRLADDRVIRSTP
jgi:hypothetical protein